jgi:hypothetical protein
VRLRLVDDPTAKARQRLRTAAWRLDNDRRGRPTAEQIGKALLLALCTSRDFRRLLNSDLSVVGVAVEDMVQRGFARAEIHDVMKRIRCRHVDPMDRAGEADENTCELETLDAQREENLRKALDDC